MRKGLESDSLNLEMKELQNKPMTENEPECSNDHWQKHLEEAQVADGDNVLRKDCSQFFLPMVLTICSACIFMLGSKLRGKDNTQNSLGINTITRRFF